MTRNNGLALVAIGVLLIALGNLLDTDLELWLSVGGLLLTIVGAVITWRTRPDEP